MNRRTFFERMAVGMAGAITAAKLTRTSQPVDLSPEQANDPEMNPVPGERSWSGDLSGEWNPIIGVAMERADVNGEVVVMLSNSLGGRRLLSTMKAGEPIDIGMFVSVGQDGTVHPASVPSRPTRG